MSSAIPPDRFIPSVSGTILRLRLLEKLEGIHEYKLTLISAPPGYGKTVALAHFAQRTSMKVIWHTIEERERDLPNLYDHGLKVAGGLFPDLFELGSVLPGQT